MDVISEIGTLIWNHPYVSCSLLVFLTPPFFPILKFFSPLLISTALFFVALVTMGPRPQDPYDQEGGLQSYSEARAGDEAGSRSEDGERDVKRKKTTKDIRSTWSDWVKSSKESGMAWVEQKLRNENWRGASLNDENVSILQEAFSHRAEEKPRAMMKLVTRRIPAEEEIIAEEHALQRRGIPEFSNSDSWRPSRSSIGRSFERPPSFSAETITRDLSHNIFSPHPSFSGRHETDTSLFENAVPAPIEHDMPPLVTGPASVTGPVYRSFEDDMDTSDDEYGHHHSHHDEHMHLEVGERSLDSELISQDALPVANRTYNQPAPFMVEEQDLPSSSESDEERSYFRSQRNGGPESSFPTMHDEVHSQHVVHDQQPPASREESSPHDNGIAEEHSLSTHALNEERSIRAPNIHHESHHLSAAPHEARSQLNNNVELHDMPELEDIQPVESGSRELPAAAPKISGSLPRDLHDTGVRSGDVPDNYEKPGEPDVTADLATDSEGFRNEQKAPAAPTNVSVEPLHFVERSMSLPVFGSFTDTGHLETAPGHEDLPPLDELLPDNLQETSHSSGGLDHAISLPALNPIHPIVIPPRQADQGPRSPDTDLGYITTPDFERRGLASRPFAAERYNSITSISDTEFEHLPAKQLSTKEKLSNLEALCNSIPSPSGASAENRPRPEEISILRATTEEQVTHVAGKMKSFVEDSPSKKFQPDAPQLQITPPSIKVPLNGAALSKSAILASTIGRPSIRPPTSRSYTARYSSSESSSEDEQIDLDSDPEGTDSESDFEIPEPVKTGKVLKPPPKPPAKMRAP